MRSSVGGCVVKRLAKFDLAAAERVDDVGRRLRGVDVHRHLLGVGVDLLERPGQRLAVAEQRRRRTGRPRTRATG